MTQTEEAKKLSKNEYYKCPFPHVHPKHRQAFFKDFDAHFRIFGGREDHFALMQLHEELAWNARRQASERGNLSNEKLQLISLAAWLDAVEKHTGKPVQVVKK
jgi:hypothetical protein